MGRNSHRNIEVDEKCKQYKKNILKLRKLGCRCKNITLYIFIMQRKVIRIHNILAECFTMIENIHTEFILNQESIRNGPNTHATKANN